MELYVLCLPVSYEELSTFLHGKPQLTIDDFKNEPFLENTYVNKEHTNKNVYDFEYSKGKNVINDIVYNIKYNEEPVSDDLCCWWCCHTFEGRPLGYPIKYIDTTNTFVCRGIFCGFSCAMSYGSKEKCNYNTSLLKLLYRNTYEIKWTQAVNICKAGPKEVLKKFGGPIDIKDYRETQNKHMYLIYKMPTIYMNEQIHLQIKHGQNCNPRDKIKSKFDETTIKQSKARILLQSQENFNKNNTITEKLKNSKNKK